MKKIRSLEEYISEVNLITKSFRLHDNTTTHAWFRGQSNSTYKLLPGIYRKKGDNYYEREMIRDCKLMTYHYLKNIPKNDLEWLFIMQHYGLPTRLLDWTESSLFALYFAVLNYKDDIDAAVWILDAWMLNELTIEIKSIPTSDSDILKDYCFDPKSINIRTCSAKYPVAIRPLRNTNRIIAQKGTFTLHGYYNLGLDEIEKEIYRSLTGGEIFLSKITIDAKYKLNILRELIKSGITHSVLFPELQGIIEELNFRYSNEYMYYHGHRHSGFKL